MADNSDEPSYLPVLACAAISGKHGTGEKVALLMIRSPGLPVGYFRMSESQALRVGSELIRAVGGKDLVATVD